MSKLGFDVSAYQSNVLNENYWSYSSMKWLHYVVRLFLNIQCRVSHKIYTLFLFLVVGKFSRDITMKVRPVKRADPLQELQANAFSCESV